MASSKKLILKLLVEKEKKRVVFAEADKDFVDILFSFLTLPMGTITRLLGKQTSLGCMDKLYESVEKLDEKYFQTEACKTMLLSPLYTSGCRGPFIEHLSLNVDDATDPYQFYTCSKPKCCISSFPFYSSVPNAKCGCGQFMDFNWEFMDFNWDSSQMGHEYCSEDGVFVKGMASFIISDNLQVMPASTAAIQNLLEKLGIDDANILEEMTIDVTKEVLLNLLKRSLLSESPLSGICFQGPIDDAKSLTARRGPKIENTDDESKMLELTILLCKSSHKVAYAETTAGEGLVDALLSLLTFPLGSIVKLLDKNSLIGCVDNLYKSVEKLSMETDCFKSDEHKGMLLAPKLAPYFGCSNSLLPYIEMVPGTGMVPGCCVCFLAEKGTAGTDKCEHGKKHVSLDEMNPKRPTSKEVGGGYVKEKIKFMITDDLEIVPFSALLSIQIAKELGLNCASLEERKVSIGKTEALNLLKFCLTSQGSLSNVFLTNKQPKRKRHI